MRNKSNLFRSSQLLIVLFSVLVLLQANAVCAQNLLDDVSDVSSKQFLILLSGSVGSERFTNTKALLTISNSPAGKPHPYDVIVVGLPRDNSNNTFFWNSDGSTMETVSSSVKCTFTRARSNSRDMHFFYWDTRSHKPKGIPTQHDKEDFEYVKKTAPPVRVNAEIAELKFNVVGSNVSGEITMDGYDVQAHQYVKYNARFSGQLNFNARTRTQVGKFD